MSATNQLIEAMAEGFEPAMLELLRAAALVGDTRTLEAVAEVFREDCEYEFVVESDKIVALVNAARTARLMLGKLGPGTSPGTKAPYDVLVAALNDFDGKTTQ